MKSFLIMLLCSVFAIIFHAMLPQDANQAVMNSIFIEKFGTPIVGSMYFIILYSICMIVIKKYGKDI